MGALCPLCRTIGEGPLGAHTDFGAASIYRCKDCVHFYCWPEPQAELLDRHYDSPYVEKRKAYFGRRYEQIMKRRADAQAALIERWAQAGRCLDVGCGIGALVASLQAGGWSAKGIDTDAEAIAYGRKLFNVDLVSGDLKDVTGRSEQWDLVCLSHVVEHMTAVRTSLAAILSAVRPGGLVFIEVPNQIHPPTGDMESHLNFFSTRSLRKLMQSVELEVLCCQSCGPPVSSESSPRARDGGIGLRVRHAIQRLTGATDWDGWYDKYHPEDEGMWIRSIGRRRIQG